MHILVINAGSSSVKFTLYDTAGMRPAATGMVERIGLAGTAVRYRNGNGGQVKRRVAVKDIRAAVRLISELLSDPENGVIGSDREVSAVGHRVVHGGEEMKAAVRIDDDVRETIRSCFQLAPLHNPPNLDGIDACAERFPGVPQVAVFDTAFHCTLPERAYLYALPHSLCQEEKIRRYGFHGTSHGYVSSKAAEFMDCPLEKLRMVTCHLGNGCSMAAVDGGRSVDTSMGFTPLEGLPMGTRCGDIDASILLYLMEKHGMDPKRVAALLNRESGFLGLGGTGSSDMRDLETSLAKGDPGAQRVIRVFAYRIKKYIGAYAFAMGGLDAIVFTAGIGENSPLIRERALTGLEGFGIRLDTTLNMAADGGIREIQHADSRVRLLVVPTDEEQEIARQTLDLVWAAE